MENKQNAKEKLKYHLVDTTALIASSNPIFSVLEKTVCKMSNEISINARLFATGLSYAGLGYIAVKGRDISKKIFKINDETKEWIQHGHDSVYAMGLNLFISPTMYFAAGARDIQEIITGTALGISFGAVAGGPMGYAIDVFRDLSGLKECNRKSYPKFIKKQNSKVKKSIMIGFMAASVGLMSLIYSLYPNKKANLEQPKTSTVIEQNFP